MGPIGKAFEIKPERKRPLLIGGGVGMPPMVLLPKPVNKKAAMNL